MASVGEDARPGIDAVVVIVELAPRVFPAKNQASHTQVGGPPWKPFEMGQRSLDLGVKAADHPDAALGTRLVVQLERQAEYVDRLGRGRSVDVCIGGKG